MADILIRGMEMPGCCGDCQFQASRWTGDFCSAGQFMFDIDFDYRDKHRQCPLVSLPAGHGRLIDADAIVAEMEKQITERDKIMELCKRAGDMENYFRCSNNQTEIVSFVRMLNNAPTIVPAEGGNADA